MRKLIFGIVAALSSVVFYPSVVEATETLSSKVVLKNSYGYFLLSDGTQWKAVPFVKRWRSLSEWWNNAQIVPQNYECLPKDWFVGAEIEVYSKYGNLSVNEADASNQDSLKQCTHILVNSNNGQVLFAIALHPAECLVRVFEDAHNDGYNEGFDEGRSASYRASKAAYDDGYNSGYQLGYKEGYRACMQDENDRY